MIDLREGGWPLIGRGQSLADALELLSAETGAGVVLAGPSGVGKSRLAREVLAEVERSGATTTWAAATEATSRVPFGALMALLPDELPPEGDRLAFYRAVARSVVEQAGGRHLVLAVDDAHLLDEASAGLVHQLAITGSVRLVLTIRAGAPAPDPIRAVWKDGLARRLDLQPLSPDALAQLLAEVLGHPVAAPTLARIWSITGGNALFLHELVQDTIEADGFDRTDGVVVWRHPLQPGHRLADLLEARLGHVSSAARACARTLALGEPLTVAVLEHLGSGAALHELEESGIARVDDHSPGREVRLVHPLYGEVLRSQLRSLAGRDLRRQLAAALAEVDGQRPGDLLRLAGLELDADLDPPPARALAAAEEANRSCDYALAARFARSALTRSPSAAALAALGEALNGDGRYAEAAEVLATVEAHTASDQELVQIARQRAEALHWGLGRDDAAREVLVSAELAVTDRASRERLQAVRASSLTSSGRYGEAHDVAAPLLADPDSDEAAQLHAVVAVGTALSLGGRTTDALDLCDRMLEPALRLGHEVPSGVGWVVFQRLLASMGAGRLDDAEELSRTAHAMAVSDRNDEVRGALSVMIGRIDLLRGRLDRAEAILREGAAMLVPNDRERYRGWCLSLLAQVMGQRGDAGTAADLMAEVDAGPPPPAVAWTDVVVGRAWAAVADGSLTRSEGDLLAAAAEARTAKLNLPEGLLLHEALRAGARAGRVADRLEVIAGRSQDGLLTIWAAHARGVADGDVAAIEAAAERFEARGMMLLAAETWADAARAARGTDPHGRSARATARSQALAAACPLARTPLLVTSASASPLTRREREVAGLAARGLSSRAIADTLLVSVRTVDGHLAQVYRKLGVSRRDELGPLLSSGGGKNR